MLNSVNCDHWITEVVWYREALNQNTLQDIWDDLPLKLVKDCSELSAGMCSVGEIIHMLSLFLCIWRPHCLECFT